MRQTFQSISKWKISSNAKWSSNFLKWNNDQWRSIRKTTSTTIAFFFSSKSETIVHFDIIKLKIDRSISFDECFFRKCKCNFAYHDFRSNANFATNSNFSRFYWNVASNLFVSNVFDEFCFTRTRNDRARNIESTCSKTIESKIDFITRQSNTCSFDSNWRSCTKTYEIIKNQKCTNDFKFEWMRKNSRTTIRCNSSTITRNMLLR